MAQEVKILHDKDADASILNGKTVAVIGYGSQGSAQALCMRDSGVNVIIGSRKGPSFDRAVADGFHVMVQADRSGRQKPTSFTFCFPTSSISPLMTTRSRST